jgi:DNA-binding response OmpR family regulator
MMKRLLLVEDDQLISKSLRLSLQYRAFEVRVCETVASGIAAFEKETFDIVILDVNLPDDTGYSLCKKIRATNRTIPVLMLTARTDEVSAVKGLESGADDYVRKPFGLEELMARIQRLIEKTAKGEYLEYQSVKMSQKQRIVWVKETPVALFKREFDILALLVSRAGEVVTRDEILQTLDKESEIYDRTIDSHLSRLRKKLKEANLSDAQIVPVYGVGYRLESK